MGGGLELGIFPEQSTHSRSSPVPPEARRWGWGVVGGCPGYALHPSPQPPARQLPPHPTRVPVGNEAAVLQPSPFFYSSEPIDPCPKRVGV